MQRPRKAAAVTETAGALSETQRAQLERQRAEEWARENQAAWAFMLESAFKEINAERRFSARHLAEAVRAKDFTDVRGRNTVISNDVVPALARLIIEVYPEGKNFIILRKARCGAAFGGDAE